MVCPNCKSDKITVAHTEIKENERLRLRNCTQCGVMWDTLETIEFCCLFSGWETLFVFKVRNMDDDRRLRERVCRSCRKSQHTFEKRTSAARKPWKAAL